MDSAMGITWISRAMHWDARRVGHAGQVCELLIPHSLGLRYCRCWRHHLEQGSRADSCLDGSSLDGRRLFRMTRSPSSLLPWMFIWACFSGCSFFIEHEEWKLPDNHRISSANHLFWILMWGKQKQVNMMDYQRSRGSLVLLLILVYFPLVM